MRMLMTVSLPTDIANDRIRSGSFGSTISGILAEMKPEAVYFTASPGGERSALVIVDMKEASEMVKYAEPWFMAFGSAVNFEPVMTPADLEKAAPHFEAALKY
jgi:hypothetical protein